MAYGDVDVNEDENDNMDVYDAADGTSGKQGFSSSFSNSSIGFQEEEIENDSERLEEREENNERNLEFDFKGFELSTASEPEKEIHIDSKSESNNTPPVSPCSEKEPGCSATRSSQGKDAGMDAGRYWEKCYCKNLTKLIDMKYGKQAHDKSLFERTVRLYIDLWGGSRAHAINEINGTIDDYFELYK